MKKQKKSQVLQNLNIRRFKRSLKTQHKKQQRTKRKQKFKQFYPSSYIPSEWLRKTEYLKVPAKFSLRDDLEDVVKFIQQFKGYAKLNHIFKSVDIDLSDVIRIDTASVSLLLSTIKELGINDINVEGNLPNDPYCSDLLIESGFLEHMPVMSSYLKSKMKQSNPVDKNMMIMNGKDKTNHREIGKIIKESVYKLTGKPAHYKPLYGVIGEMNINSLEHAYKKYKHWVFAVRHDKENDKINFTFTDNGFGIHKTLNKTFGTKAFEILGLKNEKDIVEGMFKEEYSSRFKKQFNRNKGLPAIRSLQMENKVDNLTVITNGVYINFEDGIKIDLKSKFSGTFYYWELSKETYEKSIGN